MNTRNYMILLLLTCFFVSGYAQQRKVNPRLLREKMAGAEVLTDEMELQVQEHLKEHFPEQAEKIEMLKAENPDKYRQYMLQFYNRLKAMDRIREADPERYEHLVKERELEEQSRELARQYRLSDDASQKEAIRQKLEILLYEVFEYRQANRRQEIERLEKKLEELREENALRMEKKDEVVSLQLSRLIGEKTGLEW